IEVAGETVLFLYVRQIRILLINVERLLCVGFLLRRLDGGEIRARDRGCERLARKFVVGFQRLAVSSCGSFSRADPPPHIGFPCPAATPPLHPTSRPFVHPSSHTH